MSLYDRTKVLLYSCFLSVKRDEWSVTHPSDSRSVSMRLISHPATAVCLPAQTIKALSPISSPTLSRSSATARWGLSSAICGTSCAMALQATLLRLKHVLLKQRRMSGCIAWPWLTPSTEHGMHRTKSSVTGWLWCTNNMPCWSYSLGCPLPLAWYWRW